MPAADPWPASPWPGITEIAREAARLASAASWPRTDLVSLTGDTRFADPTTVAVVAGQQPAVGLGPLYTLIKAAQAVTLASQLTAAGTPAVPVFWCASEDHDLGEAGHADLILRSGEQRRFQHALGGGKASLRFRRANDWWVGLLAHADQHLGPGVGRDWWLAHAPTADEGMGAWTCRVLAALFADSGLVCLEAHRLRPLWTATVAAALARWPVAELAERRAALLADGADDAFGELADPPLFADRVTGRTPLDRAAALRLLAEDPASLSPGAALRPVLQQAALPCALFIAGPGEMAYHRFIAPLYAALGVARPRLVPRCSMTLVQSWVARGFHRWGRSPGDDPAPPPEPEADRDHLAALDVAITGLHAHDEDTQRRLAGGARRLRREADRLRASLARGRRHAAELPAWGALQEQLRPGGRPQDRVLSCFQAVWEIGPQAAVAPLSGTAITSAPGEHRFVEFE